MDYIKSEDIKLNNKMTPQEIQDEAERFLFYNFVSFESLHFER